MHMLTVILLSCSCLLVCCASQDAKATVSKDGHPEVNEIAHALFRLQRRLETPAANVSKGPHFDELIPCLLELLGAGLCFNALAQINWIVQDDPSLRLKQQDDLIIVREIWKMVEELHGGPFTFAHDEADDSRNEL